MQYYTTNTRLPYHIPYPWYLLSMPLSDTARVVYSLILHRINLSQRNNWIDDQGSVYCVYTIKALMHDTGKSRSTITAALAELDSHDLIDRRRRGPGLPNHLYIAVPDIHASQSQDIGSQRSEKLETSNNTIKNNTNVNQGHVYLSDGF